jgi:hypothetical protein
VYEESKVKKKYANAIKQGDLAYKGIMYPKNWTGE